MSRQEKNMKTCWLFTRKELVGNEVQRKLVFCLISGQSPRCKVRTRGGQGGWGVGGGGESVLIVILSCYKRLILDFRNWGSPAYSRLYPHQSPIFLQGHPRWIFLSPPLAFPCPAPSPKHTVSLGHSPRPLTSCRRPITSQDDLPDPPGMSLRSAHGLPPPRLYHWHAIANYSTLLTFRIT